MNSKFKIVPIIISIILSIIIINIFFNENVKFENLALGSQTSVYQSKNNYNELIHITNFDSIQYFQLISNVHLKKDSLILILGNSQSHSINQLKKGQKNLISIINNNPKYENKILATTFPNANLQEFYLVYSYLITKFKFKKIIIPIFFDDMREDGVRGYFLSKILKDNFRMLDNNLVSNRINNTLTNTTTSDDNDNIALKETVQESVEKKLNHLLNTKTKLWSKRSLIRGELFDFLYKLRNTILHIRPNSIRPKIVENYTLNYQALLNILKLARINKSDVLLYIPPIRNDVKLPYDKTEYSTFKREIMILKNEHIQVLNLENIVPSNFWGYKDATNFIDTKDVDFMHFQYQGHVLISDTILKSFLK